MTPPPRCCMLLGPMNSQERHELKQNDLEAGANNFTELMRRHGNKALIVLAVAFLVLAAVRYRRAQTAQKAADAQSALVSAWNSVDQVQRLADSGSQPSADNLKIRNQLEGDVNQSVQLVIDSSDPKADAPRLASAWLARGELFWTLGEAGLNVPTPQMSTTQTSTTQTSAGQPASAGQPGEKTATQYFDLAANAYQTIVDDFPGQQLPVTVARFGLATIAENKRDFAAARTQFKALIEDKDVSPVYQSMAETRLANLDNLEKPILLLPATQPVPTTPAFDLSKLSPNMDLHMGPTMAPMSNGTPTTMPTTTQP